MRDFIENTYQRVLEKSQIARRRKENIDKFNNWYIGQEDNIKRLTSYRRKAKI